MTKKTLANMQVRIGGDTKELESSFKKARKQMKTVAVGIGAITATASAAFAGMLALTNQAADYADKIDKSAIKTGLARETLQSLAYVADQAGIEYNSLEGSVTKLNKSVGDALVGSKRQADAFDKLNVSIKNNKGELRQMSDLYPEVIAKLSEMDNETERNALAMEIMGRSATDVVPRLAVLGKEGLDQLLKKSKDLNLVMSNDSIATLVNYKDSLSTLKQQFQATMREATIPFARVMNDDLIPALSEGLDSISDWLRVDMSSKLKREQAELNTLANSLIAANDNERARATIIEEINKKYPNFLKGIDTEKTGLDDIKTRLALVNQQYKDRIKLMIVSEDAAEKEKELNKLYREQADHIKEITEAFNYISKNRPSDINTWIPELKRNAESFEEILDAFRRSSSKGDPMYIMADNAEKKYIELQNQIKETESNYEVLLNKRLHMEDLIATKIAEQGDLLSKSTEQTKSNVSKVKEELDTLEDKTVTVQIKTNQIKQKLEGAGAIDPTNLLQQLDEVFEVSRIKMQEQIDELNAMVEAGIENMVVTISKGFGQLMSGEIGLDGFFSKVLSQFGQFMVQMGEMLVAYGIAMDSFKKAFTSPFAAIAAGAALIAIGTAISSLASSGPSGGSSTRSDSASYDTRRFSNNSFGSPALSTGRVSASGNTSEMNINVNVNGKLGHDAIYLSAEKGKKNIKVRG